MEGYRNTFQHVFYNPRLNTYKQRYISTCLTSNLPELAQVSHTLLSQSKYDVGSIEGMAPIVITPKSSFHPCKEQEGIIVLCEMSPVRTPIFPS